MGKQHDKAPRLPADPCPEPLLGPDVSGCPSPCLGKFQFCSFTQQPLGDTAQEGLRAQAQGPTAQRQAGPSGSFSDFNYSPGTSPA